MPVTAPESARVNERISQMNRRTFAKLTPFEQKQVEAGLKKPIYIYNVSSVHQWARFQGQLGTLTIKKRIPPAVVSEPLVIPGVVARRYDHGLGRFDVMLEEGQDIAEDVCGCSSSFPSENQANNLLLYGVFIVGNEHGNRPFEELGKRTQEELLDGAYKRLRAKLSSMVLQADQWWEGIPEPRYKALIGTVHRDALRALNEMTGATDSRPWSTINYSKTTEQCPFCGTQNVPGVALCLNCKEVINRELYEKLKGGKK